MGNSRQCSALKNLKFLPDAIQMINYPQIKRKWLTHLIVIFHYTCICATSKIAHPNNVPSHDVCLNNPTDKKSNFEQIDNMTVLHYINKLKPPRSCGHENISSNVQKLLPLK